MLGGMVSTKRLIIFVTVVLLSVFIILLGYRRSTTKIDLSDDESDSERSTSHVPIEAYTTTNYSQAYTTKTSPSTSATLLSHTTDIATTTTTSQPVHLTDTTHTSSTITHNVLSTSLQGPWKSVAISSSFPYSVDSKCKDIICSNFVEVSKTKCGNTPRTAKASCHFQDGASNIWASLLSFPGSGNTWARQLLEKATGVCTGSIYCDGSLLRSGMIGEGVNGPAVLVVKSHQRLMKVNATVFIVRNPFKAVESFYKWSLGSYGGKDAHTNNPPISKFRTNGRWSVFVTQNLKLWIQLLERTLNTLYPRVIVEYENIKKNTSREVFRILDFLNFNYSPDDVVKRLHQDDFTVFKRVKTDFDPYTPEQREYIENELKELINRLRENNHDFIIPTIQLYLET